MRPNIFVSYSHADSAMVAPVVALLRASQALVFRDADGIRPGKKWRNELDAAILDARIVVVFWCHHAQSSTEVSKEFKAAIAHGKDVLPLLIDETPLPSDLEQFQYIDFRAAFAKTHGPDMPPTPAQPYRSISTWRSRAAWLGGLGFATILFLSYVWLLKAPTLNAPPSGPPDSPSSTFPRLTVVISGLLFLAFLLVRRLTRKDEIQYNENPDTMRVHVSDEHVLVARKLEQEIVRRTSDVTP